MGYSCERPDFCASALPAVWRCLARSELAIGAAPVSGPISAPALSLQSGGVCLEFRLDLANLPNL